MNIVRNIFKHRSSNKDDTLEDLYRQIAELTYNQCQKECQMLGICCTRLYCNLVIRKARKEYAIELQEENGIIPLLGKNNQCIAEPYMRPLCSMHICKDLLDDKQFSAKYFELRDRIENLEGRSIYEFVQESIEYSEEV